jgi:hypothetical protein
MAEHRPTRTFSDRGNIKDIQSKVNDSLEEDPQLPPTPEELQIKGVYEQAMITRDQALLDSLGLIVMTGPVKDPVALYRHREYVRSLSEKFANEAAESKEELKRCLAIEEETSYSSNQELRRTVYKQAMALAAVLDDSIVKTASATGSPDNTFRRVK